MNLYDKNLRTKFPDQVTVSGINYTPDNFLTEVFGCPIWRAPENFMSKALHLNPEIRIKVTKRRLRIYGRHRLPGTYQRGKQKKEKGKMIGCNGGLPASLFLLKYGIKEPAVARAVVPVEFSQSFPAPKAVLWGRVESLL